MHNKLVTINTMHTFKNSFVLLVFLYLYDIDRFMSCNLVKDDVLVHTLCACFGKRNKWDLSKAVTQQKIQVIYVSK